MADSAIQRPKRRAIKILRVNNPDWSSSSSDENTPADTHFTKPSFKPHVTPNLPVGEDSDSNHADAASSQRQSATQSPNLRRPFSSIRQASLPQGSVTRERVTVAVTSDAENYVIVDLTGHTDAQAIHERILSKLHIPEDLHPSFSIYRTELGVVGAIGGALDDNELLIDCEHFGDDKGTLRFLAQRSDAPSDYDSPDDEILAPLTTPTVTPMLPTPHLHTFPHGVVRTPRPGSTSLPGPTSRRGRQNTNWRVRRRGSGSDNWDTNLLTPPRSGPDSAYEREMALVAEERRREEEYERWMAEHKAKLVGERQQWVRNNLNPNVNPKLVYQNRVGTSGYTDTESSSGYMPHSGPSAGAFPPNRTDTPMRASSGGTRPTDAPLPSEPYPTYQQQIQQTRALVQQQNSHSHYVRPHSVKQPEPGGQSQAYQQQPYPQRQLSELYRPPPLPPTPRQITLFPRYNDSAQQPHPQPANDILPPSSHPGLRPTMQRPLSEYDRPSPSDLYRRRPLPQTPEPIALPLGSAASEPSLIPPRAPESDHLELPDILSASDAYMVRYAGHAHDTGSDRDSTTAASESATPDANSEVGSLGAEDYHATAAIQRMVGAEGGSGVVIPTIPTAPVHPVSRPIVPVTNPQPAYIWPKLISRDFAAAVQEEESDENDEDNGTLWQIPKHNSATPATGSGNTAGITTAEPLVRRTATRPKGLQLRTDGSRPSYWDSTRSPSPTEDSSTLFKWVKGQLIGQGRSGRVYHAMNLTTGEMIAVRQIELPKTCNDDADSRQMSVVNALRSESDILRNLDHPHIVQYLGFEETMDTFSLFMEYVPGGTIGSVMRKIGKFEDIVVRSFSYQIIDGLSYLHKSGILHRDLKGDSILVDRSGICKISSFGISKRSRHVYDDHQGTAMQGTVYWMAPEMLHSKQGYSAKIDIWSVGCVVLEMQAGRHHWTEDDTFAVMYKVGGLRQAPPVPDDVILSPLADDFRKKCSAIDPAERPTAAELLTHPWLQVPPGWRFRGFKESRAPPASSSGTIRATNEAPPVRKTETLQPDPTWKVIRRDVAYPSKMSIHEMFEYLTRSGCPDLTQSINPDGYSKRSIAAGGFGDIFKGKLNDGTPIAIKVWRSRALDEELGKDGKRAMREIYNWSQLDHENVQKLLGVVVFDERLGMVSKWMERGNLQEYLQKNPDVDGYPLCTQVAQGVEYLHDRNMIHGDLKATNVLVSSDHKLKLTDFDYSIMAGSTVFSQTTRLGGVTLRWMAPELVLDLEGDHQRNRRTDIYALGMTFLETINRAVPYYPQCKTDGSVFNALSQKRFPQRDSYFFGSDQRGDRMWVLLMRCWNHDPAARPIAAEVTILLQKLVRETESRSSA